MSKIKTPEEIAKEVMDLKNGNDMLQDMVEIAVRYHSQFNISDEEIRDVGKKYGEAIVNGKIPWIQKQIGDNTESFIAGARWARNKISILKSNPPSTR